MCLRRHFVMALIDLHFTPWPIKGCLSGACRRPKLQFHFDIFTPQGKLTVDSPMFLRPMWSRKCTGREGDEAWDTLPLQMMPARSARRETTQNWRPLEIQSGTTELCFSQKETESPITEKVGPTTLSAKPFYFVSSQHFHFWKCFHTSYLQDLSVSTPARRPSRVTQVETSLEHQLVGAQSCHSCQERWVPSRAHMPGSRTVNTPGNRGTSGLHYGQQHPGIQIRSSDLGSGL